MARTSKHRDVLAPLDEKSFVERHWFLLLMAITLLGTGLRCYGLANRSLWYDEACSIYGSTFVNWQLDFLNPKMCREMPLNAFLTKMWYPLVAMIPGVRMGSAASDFLLRLMPCATGALIIPTTFLLARWLLRNTLAALLAAFLIAISPFQIVYAQELRPHALYTLATAASAYCMLRAFDENRLRYWVWTAVWMAISLWAYYMAVFFFIGMNVLFFVNFQKWKMHFWKGVLTQAVAGLLMLPAILLAHTMLKYQQLATEFYFPFPTARTATITLKDFLAGYSPNAYIYIPLFALGIALALLGVWKLRKGTTAGIGLLVLIFVPIVSNILFWYVRGFPYYTHRAQLPSAVPFAILIAVGIVALRRPVWVGSATVLLAALTMPVLADHYAQRMHPSWDHRMGARFPVDIRGSAEYIAAHFQPGDTIGNVTHFTQGSYQYHYLPVRQHVLGFTEEDSKGLFKGNADANMWKTTGWIPVRIENAIEGAKRVWLVTSWWEPYNPPPMVSETRAWFDAHGIRLDHARFEGVSVYLYDMEPTLRQQVTRNQIADRGDSALYRYTFPNGVNNTGMNAQCDRALRNEARLFLQDPKPQLGADFEVQAIESAAPAGTGLISLAGDAGTPMAGAVPIVENGRYSGRVRFSNGSNTKRNLKGTIYEPRFIIEALAFDREPNSDAWRPSHRVNFHPPPQSFDSIGYAAHLDRQVTRSTLRTSLSLEPGTYAAYIHFAEECLPKNEFRAFLHGATADASGHTLEFGTLSGRRGQGTSGWRWRRLGAFAAPGGAVTLGLTVSNDDNLPNAYFDFDRVMILPAAQGGGDIPPPASQFLVTLSPNEERSIPISGAMAGAASKHVEIEIEDLATHESRRLFSETVPSPPEK